MAREHLLLNVENEEDTLHQAPAPMTRRQKWKNWWYYHKFHLLVGLVAIVIGGYLFYGVVTEVKPDYTIVMLSKSGYAGDLMENLGDQLSVYGKDRNGDGKVIVTVNLYQYNGRPDEAEDTSAFMAAAVQLAADLQERISVCYVTDCEELLNADGALTCLGGTENSVLSGEAQLRGFSLLCYGENAPVANRIMI